MADVSPFQGVASASPAPSITAMVRLANARPKRHSQPRNLVARLIRQAIAQHGGHATLIPAPSEMRVEIPVFEPQPKVLAGLSRRLKPAFDPYAILEPRRLWVEF
jgi:hypothetical protein